jgi:hypothetical protein
VTCGNVLLPPPLHDPEWCSLSGHALLIAAIFVPYMLLMIGLGAYIWHTGQPRSDREQPADDQDRDGDAGPMLAAA